VELDDKEKFATELEERMRDYFSVQKKLSTILKIQYFLKAQTFPSIKKQPAKL
jgi:hypothetical protein